MRRLKERICDGFYFIDNAYRFRIKGYSCRSGETGRRTGLKIPRGQLHVGSIPTSGTNDKRPLKNAYFCLSSRKAITLTTGIHLVFRGLKFEPDAEIGQKEVFCKGFDNQGLGKHQTAKPFLYASHKSLAFFLSLFHGQKPETPFSAPRTYPVGSFLKLSAMKKMLDILQCSSLYIVRI
jgi:hypothetical protein